MQNLQKNQTIVDGLVKQWCYGIEKKCGHYITTREELKETSICDTRFNHPEYIGSRMDTVTQEKIVSFLRHQPYCAYCIQDNGSYLFQAYNDLSEEDVSKVIEKYVKNYPKEIRQPFMYSHSDKSLNFRIKTHSVLFNHQTDGFLDIKTMIIKFYVCTQKGKIDENYNQIQKWINEKYTFDLSCSKEWQQMLEVFPQPLLKLYD